jgi:hypothetical protein
LSYDSVKEQSHLLHQPNAHNTMSLFIPPNQLQNMIDAEVGQALCGRANVGKLVALSTLMQSQHQQQRAQKADNWLDDNWLDDPSWL